MPWYCNFFSMRLFKYFFRQFSYKSIQVTIFQVSLKLVEGLWRYGWKKVTRNVTSYFIYRITSISKIYGRACMISWLFFPLIGTSGLVKLSCLIQQLSFHILLSLWLRVLPASYVLPRSKSHFRVSPAKKNNKTMTTGEKQKKV